MIDASPTFSEIQEMEARVKGKKLIVVANKMDEKEVVLADYPWTIQPAFLAVSAKYNRNIDLLEATIYHAADIPEIHENDVIVTNARHYEALLHAQESIGRVIEGIVTGLSGDLLSEDLRQCIHQLSEITGGTITTSDVLNSIFKDFCIGK